MSEKKGQEPIVKEKTKEKEPAKTAPEAPKAEKNDGEINEETKKRILEEQKALLEKKKAEIEIYLKDGLKITTIRGSDIIVPPLNGKMEKKALRLVLEFILTNPKVIALFTGGGKISLSPAGIMKLLSADVGDEAFDCIKKLAAILVDKPKEWVDENLLFAEMMEIVRPFFLVEGKTLSQFRQRI